MNAGKTFSANLSADGEEEDEDFANLWVLKSFRKSVYNPVRAAAEPVTGVEPVYDVRAGRSQSAAIIREVLSRIEPGGEILIFLSSETMRAATDEEILAVIREQFEEKQCRVNVLVQSANNSLMLSRLVSAYMAMLVQGRLTISLVQGTPQTFTATMNIIAPGKCAIIVIETTQKKAPPVCTVIRELSLVAGMEEGFAHTMRTARPLMTAYDDNCARNIIEAFFEEYGVPGSLDVIKSGMNPMYMTVRQYGEVLRKAGHTGEQFDWRYQEFERFKAAMDEVLSASRFREVLSLTKLNKIAETGRCRMPAMYFFGTGIWEIDAADCVDVLNGYIRYLNEIPNFEVILLDDEQLFMENSCWHIKNNKHIMIHSWNADSPIVVFSDQLVLIDEFQKHFDHLWNQINTMGASKRLAVELLTEVRDRCLAKVARSD